MGLLKRYASIPRSSKRVIAAKYLSTTVSASFMLILNIYLRKLGLDDVQIGGIVAVRYAGGLLLSLPEGLFVRGRRLKPFLLSGTILVPILALSVLISFKYGYLNIATWLMLGLSMSLLQLDSFTLPFVLRAKHKESEPEAISLAYAAHAGATIFCGVLIMGMGLVWPEWDANGDLEFYALSFIAILSIPAVWLIYKAEEKEPDPTGRLSWHTLGGILSGYDWRLLGRGLFPSLLMAIGAGLTIPFINLFFNAVFGVDSDELALIGILTYSLVFSSALWVPTIRRRHGYYVAITLVQGLAILMLAGLAMTELFAYLPWMVYLAVLFYVIRSPLMNMAGPMSNELLMNYVGKRNQDLAGALHASIWSGAWFISAGIFRFLRGLGLPYFQVFFITVGLYLVAVFFYVLLIRDYSRKLPETGEKSLASVN